MRSCRLWAGLMLLVVVAPPCQAAWSLTGLGSLVEGGTSAAMAVSADGQVVVGMADNEAGTNEAFRWTAADGMVALGVVPKYDGTVAYDLSADGSVVVGTAGEDLDATMADPLAPMTGFVWTADSGMVRLEILPGYVESDALGVSDDGSVIVGSNYTDFALPPDTQSQEAVRWTSDGPVGMGDMVGGDRLLSLAYGVSPDGAVVVGTSITPNLFLGGEAFRWTAESGMVGLGWLSRPFEQSMAFDASTDGSTVVGFSGSVFDETGEAFRWTADTGMVGLGNFPGADSSAAYAVSADGAVIVGISGDQAFIWDRVYGMRSLDNVLTDHGVDLDGWTLTEAWTSADGHVIVGSGVNPLGIDEAWIASIGDLLIHGDMNQDGAVNGLDVDPFVAVVVNGTDDNATRITADMNGDGAVNGLDVDPFVQAVVGGAGTAAVPEPGTMMLLLSGCGGLLLAWATALGSWATPLEILTLHGWQIGGFSLCGKAHVRGANGHVQQKPSSGIRRGARGRGWPGGRQQ